MNLTQNAKKNTNLNIKIQNLKEIDAPQTSFQVFRFVKVFMIPAGHPCLLVTPTVVADRKLADVDISLNIETDQ